VSRTIRLPCTKERRQCILCGRSGRAVWDKRDGSVDPQIDDDDSVTLHKRAVTRHTVEKAGEDGRC